VVELVTGVLADQLELPDFEAWLKLYEQNPAAVEDRLLGILERGRSPAGSADPGSVFV
jgi:hypothetical protein